MESMDSHSPTDLATKDKKKLITSGSLFSILKVFSHLYGNKAALDSDSFIIKTSTYSPKFHFKYSGCYLHEIYSVVVLTAATFQ